MRASVVLYLVGFALILVLFFVVAQGVVVSQILVLVDDLTGRAEVQPKNKTAWVVLAPGNLVKEGDRVRTGPGSGVDLAWVGGTHVRLGPNTEFKVVRTRRNNAKRATSTETMLSIGKIWVRLRESLKGTSKFTVKTPTIVAAVRGTIFSVEVLPDGSTRVEGFEGRVGVKQGDQGSLLRDRNVATYSKAVQPVRPQPMTEEQISGWQENQAVVGAFLSVQQPQDGEQVSSPLVVVSGYTDPGNVVEVNGAKTTSDKEGKWSARAVVQRGENSITVQATDVEGRQRTVVRKVTY